MKTFLFAMGLVSLLGGLVLAAVLQIINVPAGLASSILFCLAAICLLGAYDLQKVELVTAWKNTAEALEKGRMGEGAAKAVALAYAWANVEERKKSAKASTTPTTPPPGGAEPPGDPGV